MRLAILGLLSCLCLSAQQASLEGITVDAVTQQPLAGVHVSLVSMGVGTNLPEPDDAYGAISDAAGHYAVGNIRPGAYVLSPKHAGYVYVRESDIAATPTITLKAGEQNAGYRIVMTPEAMIAGRVIDEFGDPVQGVSVRAEAAADPAPHGLWMINETDDRGDYRLSGIPGKYYIEASVPPLQNSGSAEIRTDGSSTTAYATTYYPGALAKERGKVVETTAGQELTGIDIHVAHRKSLKISGVVTGTHAGNGAHATVTILVRHDGAEAADNTDAAADGNFVFAGLAPAEYYLYAEFPSGVSGVDPLQSPIIKVTVETEDAAVTLPLTAGEEIAGTLKIEGDPPGVSRGTRTVRLTPVEFGGMPTKGGQVAPDGSFVIGRIIPGIFRLEIDPLPENSYLKSVMLGGTEAIDTDLDFSKGVRGASMKVTVSRNGGQVSGTIADKEGRQLIGHHLIVVLAADVNSFATWRTAPSGPTPTYLFHGIRPGKYRLFAADPSQFGGMRSYEPLKSIAARAEEIEIKEGDRIAKDLRVLGKDDSGAK